MPINTTATVFLPKRRNWAKRGGKLITSLHNPSPNKKRSTESYFLAQKPQKGKERENKTKNKKKHTENRHIFIGEEESKSSGPSCKPKGDGGH